MVISLGLFSFQLKRIDHFIGFENIEILENF
jgi:hypothetical protein